MQVKSFTYQKNFFGTYYKRGFVNLHKMDDHIAKMLNDGWEIRKYCERYVKCRC